MEIRPADEAPAGFLRRAAAYLIDSLIVTFPWFLAFFSAAAISVAVDPEGEDSDLALGTPYGASCARCQLLLPSYRRRSAARFESAFPRRIIAAAIFATAKEPLRVHNGVRGWLVKGCAQHAR